MHHFGSMTYRSMGIDFASLMNRNQQLFLEKWSHESDKQAAESAPPQPGVRFELIKSDEPELRVRLVRPLLSLCMIVRDSSRTLGACLESIRPWVDEIIVVDTGSVDATPEIAESYGANVFYFPWCDDFSAARNQSLSHATGDWLFWMDSDDTIDAENGRKLRELVEGPHTARNHGLRRPGPLSARAGWSRLHRGRPREVVSQSAGLALRRPHS